MVYCTYPKQQDVNKYIWYGGSSHLDTKSLHIGISGLVMESEGLYIICILHDYS